MRLCRKTALETAAALATLYMLCIAASAAPAASRDALPGSAHLALSQAGRGDDDTVAFKKAIDATPDGGLLFIPAGRYRFTGTLDVTRPITLAGSGIGTQLFEESNTTLLRLTGVNGAVVRDLYLGSSATAADSALIELNDSNHNRVDNVFMLGGFYGLHLIASILNTIIDLRSGSNLQGYAASHFFADTSTNQFWVYAEGGLDANRNYVAANANTFIAPDLDGGVNGVYITDSVCSGCIRGGQGSLQMFGGSIEGIPGVALTFQKTFLPSTVTGVHFEKNGTDILINDSANIRMTGLNSTSVNWSGRGIVMVGTVGPLGLPGYYVKNIQITDSYVDKIDIASDAPGARSIRLENIVLDCPAGSPVYLNVPATVSQTNVTCDYPGVVK